MTDNVGAGLEVVVQGLLEIIASKKGTSGEVCVEDVSGISYYLCVVCMQGESEGQTAGGVFL